MSARFVARSLSAALLIIVPFVIATPARAQAPVPEPPADGWVVDGAGLLKPGEIEALREHARTCEREEGVRLAVLTLADARGEEPKAIAVRTLNEWRLGRRSVLLLVVMNPKKLYLQPGIELNATFDEPTSSALCRDAVAPKMRTAPGEALLAGLKAIHARVKMPQPSSPSARASSGTIDLSGPLGCGCCGGTGLVGLVGLFFVSRRFAKKCASCGGRLSGTSRTAVPATYASAGKGERCFSCRGCGASFVEPFVIPMLLESTLSTSTWDSSSSSSSYDSGSSSSSSDSGSSSSSSSDGSGGGGSDF